MSADGDRRDDASQAPHEPSPSPPAASPETPQIEPERRGAPRPFTTEPIEEGRRNDD
jgi:hypothetical protein